MRKNKKYSFIAALALLTGCASVQEVETASPAAASFEVFAPAADTRTVNDDMSTLWVEGDRFSLFHAAAGTQAYTADGAFTVDEVGTGHAKGSVTALGEGTYNWYMVYPYAASATTPKSVPVTVGAASGKTQVQQGADNMAHLAGETFPLSGKASAVDAAATPVLPVAPLLSVIAVNVTNPGEADFTVTSLRFHAPEAVVGTFQVDVTGDKPAFTAVNASEDAVLSVSGGALLHKEENAVFYLGVKPFVAGAGTTLTLEVNDVVRTVTLTRPVSFEAGKIKTLNLTLDPSDPASGDVFYFKRVAAFSPGRTYIFVTEPADEEGNVQYRMARSIPASATSGRLAAQDVAVESDIVTLTSLEDAFTFYDSENGTLIRQKDGRYLYAKMNNSNFFAGSQPGSGYYWTISFESTGEATLTSNQLVMKYNSQLGTPAFQMRKTTESGFLVHLYELQNTDEAVEAFLRNTAPGVYAYEGAEWLYEEGAMQLSVRTGGGTTAFRIFEPSTYTVVQLTGIPEAIAEKDRFDVRLARYVKQAATHLSEFSVQVVQIADGKAWLMSGSGTGFIVCLQ